MTLQRLAYVLNIFPKLSETFIAGELVELRRRGVELRILSLLPPRDELQHDIVKRARLDKLVCYEPEKFSNVVREFQPQLLHAHFAREATAEARRLGAKHRLPFTFTAHGYDIHRKPPEDFAARADAARAVVTVSEANADYIAATFGVSREAIHVIPCGVDTEKFRPGVASRLNSPGVRPSSGAATQELLREISRSETFPISDAGAPGDGRTPVQKPPVILCLARHVAVKNLGLLLDACAELRRRGVEFHCVMIGHGPLHEDLKIRRATLGLEDRVAMPGAAEQGEVLKWWQRASIGVLTSQNEGMPVSLMEAAACGVPVVAPAVGGIPELVLDGETGLLTKPGDKESLVTALQQLLTEEPLRRRLGAAARKRAMEKFSVRRQVELLLALWSRVLNGDGAR